MYDITMEEDFQIFMLVCEAIQECADEFGEREDDDYEEEEK